jgi:ankyrin repeat protein
MNSLENKFLLACETGDIFIVHECLRNPVLNVNIDDNAGFKYAAMSGHDDIVQLLFSLEGEKRISFDEDIYWVLHSSLINGYSDVFKSLMEEKDDREILFKYGLKNKSGIQNLDAVFTDACYYQQKEIVDYMLTMKGERKLDLSYANQLAFSYAYRNNDDKVVRSLLTVDDGRKIDVFYNENLMFEQLSYSCNKKVLDVIFECGDIEEYLSKGKENKDVSPFIYALENKIDIPKTEFKNLFELILYFKNSKDDKELLKSILTHTDFFEKEKELNQLGYS